MPGQAPPFPGFSMDHFKFGFQQGQQGFNPPGQPGMGDMPGPGEAAGPSGPMGLDYGGFEPPQGSQDPTGGMQGMPDQGNGYAGPSPWGVWGDQDLVNDPAYADNAQTAHPKWNRFLQYMNTPQAKDSMMLGVIMSRMGVDPEGTLKLAQQYREHQTQRAFQAQQNELQREATQENIKYRTQYQKEKDDESKQRTMLYKIDQAHKNIADLGGEIPEMPDDPAAWSSHLEDLRTTLSKAQAKKKEEDLGRKDRIKAFSESGKTGVVDEKYADDPMVQASAQAYTDRKLRADERLDLARNREEQLKTIRERLPDVALQAKNLNNVMSGIEKDINRYEDNIFKIESGLYSFMSPDDPSRKPLDAMIQNYQQKIGVLEEKRTTYQDKWDNLVTTKGEKQPPSTVSASTPSGTTVAQTAGAPTAPSADAVKGYQKALQTIPKAVLDDAWRRKYGTDPPKEN